MPNYKKSKPAYRKKARKPMTPATVAKIARKVTHKERPVKEIRYSLSSLDMQTSGPVTNFTRHATLTTLVQGDQINQRTGDTIFVSGVRMKLSVCNRDTTSRLLRVMLLRPNNPSALADLVAYSDVYENFDYVERAPNASLQDATANINLDQYVVHYDNTFRLPPYTQAGPTLKDVWIPIARKVEYETVASTNVTNGRIYLVWELIQPDNILTADITTVSIQTRMFFKDA